MDDNGARRILVVDDDTININILCHILMPKYDVIVAKTGQSAIQRAIKHVPDIILLDVILPDLTGFDVIVNLKESDITRRIPIIFITGLNSSENEEKGLMLGAVDYITKPFNDAIVKARVHTHLQIVEYINTIERLGNVDALTGIPNRRSFNSQINIEWERAIRDQKPIAFLMLDIDHFKNYNDTYGHPQGDALLTAAAQTFKQSLLRPADYVARWGGEEFAVLLPATDRDGALDVAERIRYNVECLDVPTIDGTITNITVSIGVASEYPIKGDSVDSFLESADKALYRAKTSGRNRVCPA